MSFELFSCAIEIGLLAKQPLT